MAGDVFINWLVQEVRFLWGEMCDAGEATVRWILSGGE